MYDHSLPIVAQTAARVRFIECALRALVSAYPLPKKLGKAFDHEFASALAPNARPELVAQRNAFITSLREAPSIQGEPTLDEIAEWLTEAGVHVERIDQDTIRVIPMKRQKSIT